MKRIYAISFISTIAVIIVAALFQFLVLDKRTQKHIKVGFVYVGDTSTVYTGNFVKAQNAIEKQYGDRVKTYAKYNVPEGNEGEILQELIDTGCELIFMDFPKRQKNMRNAIAMYSFVRQPDPMPMKSQNLAIIILSWEQFIRDVMYQVWQQA